MPLGNTVMESAVATPKPIMRIRLWKTLATVWVCLLLMAAQAPGSARAQSTAWSPPIQLSGADAAAFPDVAADAAGGVWVAWSSTDDLYDTVFLTTREGEGRDSGGGEGLTWVSPIDIVAMPHLPGESYVTRPVLDIADSGRASVGIHGVSDNLLVGSVLLAEATDPAAWQIEAIEARGYHALARITATGYDVLYTQRVESANCTFCMRLFHTASVDDGETWSDPVDISRRPDRGAAKPQLLIAQSGTQHVVWESGLDGDRGYVTGPVRSMHAFSRDGGATWSLPVQLDPIPDNQFSEQVYARNVALAQAGDGTLITVWWQMPEDQVFYRTSSDDGQTWSSARVVPNVWGVGPLSTTRQDEYALVTDSSGAVHLLMAGRLGNDDASVSLLHLTYQGSGWSPPQKVASSDRDLIEWPQATVALGNRLEVVWHVRPGYLTPDVSDDGLFQVWQAHTSLSSPALAAVELPGPTETTPATMALSATVAVSETAALSSGPPTSAPDFDRRPPTSPISAATLMSENDDVLIVALSLLPVALLVVAAVFVRRRRRARIQG